jgi:hypothetical protein
VRDRKCVDSNYSSNRAWLNNLSIFSDENKKNIAMFSRAGINSQLIGSHVRI